MPGNPRPKATAAGARRNRTVANPLEFTRGATHYLLMPIYEYAAVDKG